MGVGKGKGRWDVPPRLRLLGLEVQQAALVGGSHPVIVGVAQISNAVR